MKLELEIEKGGLALLLAAVAEKIHDYEMSLAQKQHKLQRMAEGTWMDGRCTRAARSKANQEVALRQTQIALLQEILEQIRCPHPEN
jgi:hypothetical protein